MKDQEIEELLSAYVDGELSQRQYNEVQRLIAHEPEISTRIRRIQNTRDLIGSLPSQKAPQGLVDDVSLTLERKNLLDSDQGDYEQQSLGRKHLLRRKVLSAAAVLILAGILGAVIVSIVAPDDFTNSSQIAEKWKISPDQIDLTKIKFEELSNTVVYRETAPVHAESDTGDMIAALIVHTNDIPAAQAFIQSSLDEMAIEKSGPLESDTTGQFDITCSPNQLAMLAQNLNSVWHIFSSPTLLLKDNNTGNQQMIESVTIPQLQTVLLEPVISKKLRKASDFASLNRLAKNLPGRDVENALDDMIKSSLTIPKPILTSRQKPPLTGIAIADSNNVQPQINLMIILQPER